MAVELKSPVTADEFRTLNRCLDNAIADAVTAYAQGFNESVADKANKLKKRDNTVVEHQLRLIDLPLETFAAIKTGSLGLNGATSAVHGRTLVELREITKQTRSDLKPTPGNGMRPHR